MKAQVTTLDATDAGTIDLDDAVFGLPTRVDILHRMVRYQLAKRRAGTRKTRTVSETTGSGAKMYRQKGTGKARHSSGKVTQFRGGAKAFGPVVRSHAHKLPKKIRKLALRTALSSKQAEGKLVVLDKAELEAPKTKALLAKMNKLGWSSVLIVGGEAESNLARAAANIPYTDVLAADGANVYDILRRETLVLTRAAVESLEARLK
ncbi:MAG: 50S ribosomal protein L4 [Sphingomonadales bacterium]